MIDFITFDDIQLAECSTPFGEKRSKKLCIEALSGFRNIFGRMPMPNELTVWITPSGNDWTNDEEEKIHILQYSHAEYDQGSISAFFIETNK